jgi:hypothetical protein
MNIFGQDMWRPASPVVETHIADSIQPDPSRAAGENSGCCEAQIYQEIGVQMCRIGLHRGGRSVLLVHLRHSVWPRRGAKRNHGAITLPTLVRRHRSGTSEHRSLDIFGPHKCSVNSSASPVVETHIADSIQPDPSRAAGENSGCCEALRRLLKAGS